MPGNRHRGCSDHSGIGKAFVLGSQDNQVNGSILSHLDNLFGGISPTNNLLETAP